MSVSIRKRNPIVLGMITRSAKAGSHKNLAHDLRKGRSRKPKHKKPPE